MFSSPVPANPAGNSPLMDTNNASVPARYVEQRHLTIVQ